MNEEAVVFGADQSLVGVWCEPDGEVTSGRPAFIMLSSGIIHHAGVWRLHTRLARSLGKAGFSSLRFDLSGIGDSDSPQTAAAPEVQVQQDVAAAVGHVRDDRGFEEVVLMGLCSGAREALEGAVHNPAAVGLVAIDLIAHMRTWRHLAVHYQRRIFRVRSWVNAVASSDGLIGRQLGRLRRKEVPVKRPRHADELLGIRPTITRELLSEQLLGLVDRGVQMLFIFSGGLEFNYNHKSQFKTVLPAVAASTRVTVDFFQGVDHTFSVETEQARLISDITGWMGDRFGGKSAVAPVRAGVKAASERLGERAN